MKMIRLIIALLVVCVLFTPTTTIAKMGIRLQQEVTAIHDQDKDGTLHTSNNKIYTINNKEIKNKAKVFVGNQARILFYNIAQKKVCVNVAPITDPPFEISPPAPARITKPQ